MYSDRMEGANSPDRVRAGRWRKKGSLEEQRPIATAARSTRERSRSSRSSRNSGRRDQDRDRDRDREREARSRREEKDRDNESSGRRGGRWGSEKEHRRDDREQQQHDRREDRGGHQRQPEPREGPNRELDRYGQRSWGSERGRLEPPPRPGYDEDTRLASLQDDPRYFQGAELGKAQRAALGQTNLHGRNTASFDPNSTLVRPAMRIYYGTAASKVHEGKLLTDDLLVVPDFYCGELDMEVFKTLQGELKRLKDEEVETFDELPTARRVLRKICRFLKIDQESAALRVEWHRKGVDSKPFVHEHGNFKKQPGKGQNVAASVVFGSQHELACKRSGSTESIYLPRTNGSLSAMGKDVWQRWISGINSHKSQDRPESEGHISFIVVGSSDLVEEDRSLGPVQSDSKLRYEGLQGTLGHSHGDLARPEMRVITVAKREKYGRPVKHDDVIIVPEFWCAEDDWETYYQLIKEMRAAQAAGERRAEWISWHEGAHLLSQNPTGSKTFQKVLDKMCDYFSVAEGNRGTRFNWYRDGSDWKPFHHDSAAFNAQRAANQNCTIGISFGASRDLAFRHAKTGELIYFPQKNGMLFYFGRDANIIWQHGVNALPAEQQDGKGRISIILWGLCTTTQDEPGAPPMLTDESRDKGKGKGKGKGGFSMHGSGGAAQPCRDFQKGRCSYGDRCRFSHE